MLNENIVFSDLQNLKQFINENEKEFSNFITLFIIKLENIDKLSTMIHQEFNSNLASAHTFHFILDKNFADRINRDTNLMANVPDYISLGYDEECTEFKVKGTPI